jgi:hypothetical protein
MWVHRREILSLGCLVSDNLLVGDLTPPRATESSFAPREEWHPKSQNDKLGRIGTAGRR